MLNSCGMQTFVPGAVGHPTGGVVLGEFLSLFERQFPHLINWGRAAGPTHLSDMCKVLTAWA